MEDQVRLLAQLSAIDARLDELHDELGDLPQEVKALEDDVKGKQDTADATKEKLDEIKHLRANGNQTIQSYHDKETKLTEQQFQVKNNREFDAITKEIEHVKAERAETEERLRTASVTEENLEKTHEEQTAELEESKTALTKKEKELEALTGDNNTELKKFIEMRLKVIADLNDTWEAEYERIRTFHREAAVAIRRESCSGCYSAIPSQRVVEMRTATENLNTCENCGRILITEHVFDEVEELVEEGEL